MLRFELKNAEQTLQANFSTFPSSQYWLFWTGSSDWLSHIKTQKEKTRTKQHHPKLSPGEFGMLIGLRVFWEYYFKIPLVSTSGFNQQSITKNIVYNILFGPKMFDTPHMLTMSEPITSPIRQEGQPIMTHATPAQRFDIANCTDFEDYANNSNLGNYSLTEFMYRFIDEVSNWKDR